MATKGTTEGSVRKRHTRGCASRAGGRCRCSGTWQLRARLADGERVERSGYPTRDAAPEALGELLRDVRRGAYRPSLAPVGFAEYVEGWLEGVRPTIRRATAVSYEGAVRNHLVPYFGEVELRRITPETVRAFVAAKATATRPDGRPAWSAKTVANVLGVLKLVLSAAVEEGRLASSPAERVKPPRREDPEREVLTPAELARVLGVAGDPWALIFDVLAWTALRRGELLALRWGAVDLATGRIHVRESAGRYGTGAPKSRAGRRIVPLTAPLVAALRRHRMAQAPDDSEDGGYVFRSPAGGQLDPDNLGRAWARALRKAGVRHVPLHSLRHLAVSRMISAGASIKTIQVVVGHATVSLTIGLYGHMMPGDLDSLAGELARERRKPRRSRAFGE